MRRKRNGQVAMEFMMNYGWSFFILLGIIGTLTHFNVFSPDTYVPNRCSFVSSVSCVDSIVRSDEIKLSVANIVGRDIRVTKIDVITPENVVDKKGCSTGTLVDVGKNGILLEYGKTITFDLKYDVDKDGKTYECSQIEMIGEKPLLDIELHYYFDDDSSESDHLIKGKLIGKIDVVTTTMEGGIIAKDIHEDIKEDSPVVINLECDGAETPGYSINSNPTHGTLDTSSLSLGKVTYTPNENYYGNDEFTYQCTDNGQNSNPASVTISIAAVNDAPVANNDGNTDSDKIKVAQDSNDNIIDTLKNNDEDVDGDDLVISYAGYNSNVGVTKQGGTVTYDEDTVYYTPKAGFSGNDEFNYKVYDGKVDSNIATVTVTVVANNHDPVAQDDTATTNEDTSIAINVLANDNDPDNDDLTINSVSSPSYGYAQIDKDGSGNDIIQYDPSLNYYGEDTFSYQVSDGKGGTAIATVTVTINSVNDAPVAYDDSAQTEQDTEITISVLDNDEDVEGNSLTVEGFYDNSGNPVSQSTNGGSLALTSDNKQVVYNPPSGFYGNDDFYYKAYDSQDTSDTANVVVYVSSTTTTTTTTTSSTTTTIYYPTDDITIAENPFKCIDYSSLIFGISNNLGGNVVYDSYLKYNVDAYNIQSAKLRLYASANSNYAGDVYGLTDTTWTEASCVSSPLSTTDIITQNTNSVSSGNWYEFDVSSYVTGSGVYGFALKSENNVVKYDSEEASNKPELVVSYITTTTTSSTLNPTVTTIHQVN